MKGAAYTIIIEVRCCSVLCPLRSGNVNSKPISFCRRGWIRPLAGGVYCTRRDGVTSKCTASELFLLV